MLKLKLPVTVWNRGWPVSTRSLSLAPQATEFTSPTAKKNLIFQITRNLRVGWTLALHRRGAERIEEMREGHEIKTNRKGKKRGIKEQINVTAKFYFMVYCGVSRMVVKTERRGIHFRKGESEVWGSSGMFLLHQGTQTWARGQHEASHFKLCSPRSTVLYEYTATRYRFPNSFS